MGQADSKKEGEQPKYSDKPIKEYSFDEAHALLHGLFAGDLDAEIRLADEPYSAASLVELARRAGSSLVGVTGRCFTDVSQMEA